MKVTFVTREGYRLPGARIRCYNLAKEINKCGIDSEVFSFSSRLGAKDGINESQLTLTDKLLLNYQAFKKLAKIRDTNFWIHRFNYHSFAPCLVHILNKNRIILDLDDWEMRENPRYYLGFYPSSKAHLLTRLLAKRSIFCIAASRFLEDFLLEFNKNVYYLPSGVDTELFKPCLDSLGEDKIVFSWIGTLHKKEYIENIDLAIDVFKEIKKHKSKARVVVIGGGPLASYYLNKYGSSKGVSFIIDLDYKTTAEYFKKASILLVTSQYETLGNTVTEAMAVGLPIVAKDLDVFGDRLIDNVNCYLVQDNNIGTFANKILNLMENDDIRKKFINNSQTIVKNYDVRNITDRYISLYDSLMHS